MIISSISSAGGVEGGGVDRWCVKSNGLEIFHFFPPVQISVAYIYTYINFFVISP